MRAVTKVDFRSLLFLISFSVVGAATVGVFIGVGFLWLTDPHPGTQSADPIRSYRHKLWKRMRSGHLGTTTRRGARRRDSLPTRWRRAPRPTAIQPRGGSVEVDTESVVIGTKEPGDIWPLDAGAGPNPGGGIYGAPNINIGRINPN
jgi:hypothetical protein